MSACLPAWGGRVTLGAGKRRSGTQRARETHIMSFDIIFSAPFNILSSQMRSGAGGQGGWVVGRRGEGRGNFPSTLFFEAGSEMW